MSRQIDWTKPLSDKDREWASQFSIHSPLIEENDAVHGGAVDSLAGGADGAGDGEGEVKPYPEWTKAELMEEINVVRELVTKVTDRNTKDEMIALLEADDEAHPE